MMKRLILAMFSLAAAPSAYAQQQATRLAVPSTSDIYAATLTSDPAGGMLPPSVVLPAGTQCVQVAAVSGTINRKCPFAERCITLDNSRNLNDPSGAGGQNKVTANQGMLSISGLTAPGEGYLAGVLTAGSATGAAPPALTFGKTRSGNLAPLLNQSFFIGDGRIKDGVGRRVYFSVPAGATNLYLGVSDSCDYGYKYPHNPGCFYDNIGTFKVRVETSTAMCPVGAG